MKGLITTYNKVFNRLILLFFIGITVLFSGCKKEDEFSNWGGNENRGPAHRTILVYMLADNNLGDRPGGYGPYHFDEQNINDMVDAATNGDLRGGNLVIYRDSYETPPQLIKIHSRLFGSCSQLIVKEYPDRNSATPEVLQEVIDETVELFPANEYGLILWSHSTGWVPENSTIALAPPRRKGLPPTRSFGIDNSNYLELDELADAIPNGLFRFILSDACFSAGIEQAYQLREKAEYLIGSAAEVMGAGMPYAQTIPQLFENELNLTKVCQTIYNHYNNQNDAYRTATVSLINCRELEGLADSIQSIFAQHSDNLIPAQTSSIQRFDRQYPYICFDLREYLLTISSTAEVESVLDPALERAIPYQAATPTILNSLSIHAHCGLTSYILGSGNSSLLDSYYKTLDWYKRVYPEATE